MPKKGNPIGCANPVSAVNQPGGATVGPAGRIKGDTTRFRSFAERYVIERASSFRVGHEKEDAWSAIKDADRIYKMIARSSDPDGIAVEITT